MSGRRRSIWIGDNLWAAVVKAAAQQALESGERVTVSEWIRQAIEDQLPDRP